MVRTCLLIPVDYKFEKLKKLNSKALLMNIHLIYFLLWFPMVVLAIINGFIREKLYTRFLSSLGAHQLSTLSGIVIFGVYFWLTTNNWQIESANQAVLIGSMWMIITLLFEFIFGHFVIGHSWKILLSDFNIFKGRLWVVVLIWTAIGPWFFYSLEK